jgi:hypothetical protein
MAGSWRGAGLAVLAAWGAGAQPAFADEAYLCDGGRIVYVKLGDLERMKATDACIASHYGLTIAAPPAAAAQPVATDAARTQAPAKPAPPALSLTTISEVATPVRAARQQSAATAARPAVAHPATDFRNVTVINAAPGENVFRHAR